MVRLPLIGAALNAYVRTRWTHMTLRSRSAIEAHQNREFKRVVKWARRHTSFYAALPEGIPPVVDKALQQGRFAEFNVPGLGLEDVAAALGPARIVYEVFLSDRARGPPATVAASSSRNPSGLSGSA
jgi:hypothetical protein